MWNGTQKAEAFKAAISGLKKEKTFFEINDITNKAVITDPEAFRKAAANLTPLQLEIATLANNAGEAGIAMDELKKKFSSGGIKSAIKSFGFTALNSGITALLSYAAGAILDRFIHDVVEAGERAAEAAAEARSAIERISDTVKEAGKIVDDGKKKYEQLGETYVELEEKARSVGGFKNLSTEDYDAYLEVSEELLALFPDISHGFDDNYNRVVTLSGGVEELTKKYEDLIEKQKVALANGSAQIYSDYIKNSVEDSWTDRSKYSKLQAVRSLQFDRENYKMLSEYATKWMTSSQRYSLEQAYEDQGYDPKLVDKLFYDATPDERTEAWATFDLVYQGYMSQVLPQLETTAEELKTGLLTYFEISDTERRQLSEAGMDLISAYISGLTYDDIATSGAKNIVELRSMIKQAVLSGLSVEDISSASSTVKGLRDAENLLAAGKISASDYADLYNSARTSLMSLYGKTETVEGLIGGEEQAEYISNMLKEVDAHIESGVSEGTLDALTLPELEIVYGFVMSGKHYDSMDDVWADINKKNEELAAEAVSAPRVYSNLYDSYSSLDEFYQRHIDATTERMNSAESADEKNNYLDVIDGYIKKQIENQKAQMADAEAELAKYTLSDELKQMALFGGAEFYEFASEEEQKNFEAYQEWFSIRQQAQERIAALESQLDANKEARSTNIVDFYDDEIAWRQEAVNAQLAYLDDIDKTNGAERKTRYGEIATLYDGMLTQADGAKAGLEELYKERLTYDSAFRMSTEGKALYALIKQFEQYIKEYSDLEAEARSNEANAEFVAAAEEAQRTLEIATRNREKRVAQNTLQRAQGYEVTTIGGGEIDFVDAQVNANAAYLISLNEQLKNLEKGSEAYKAVEQQIAEAELAQLGYLQDHANLRKEAKDEAKALVDAQQALHDEAVSQFEEEIALEREKGLASKEDYDQLSKQYSMQAEMRRKEILDKKAEMEADMAARKYAYGSQRWLEEVLAIVQLEGELNNLIRKEEELARTRLDASVNPYENALASLEAEQSRRQGERELAEGEGIFDGSLYYYTTQIENSKDQIELLEEINSQKQEYLDQMVEEYGEAVKLSDTYREIQDQIDGNVDSIISAKKAMKEYEDAIERAAYVGAGLDEFAQAKNGFSPEQAVASAIEAKEAIEQGFESGYINSKSFVAAWEALIGDYETTFATLTDAERNKLFENAGKYLTEDISGQIKFFQDLSKKAGSEDYFNFVDGVAVGLKDVDLAKFVEWSGFSESFVRAMAAGMAAGSPDFSISSNWEEMTEEEQTAVEVVDEFTTKVEELTGKNIGDLGMSETESAATGLINRLAEISQAIINMPTLNISGVTLPSSTVSGHGGIEIGGSSAARGSINSRGGRTLVGELGPEIVVSGDEWHLVGQRGAEFTNLKRGDIVFNHLQSEEILKKRSSKTVGGQAKASLGASARSWVAVLDGLTKISGVKKLKRLEETLGGNFAEGGGKGSGKGSGSGSGSNKNDVKLDWVDWIEVRLKRLADVTQSWVDAAARAVGYHLQNAKLENAIAAKQEEIINNEAGYKRYMKQADSVGLSADLKKRVQDGAIDINQYDDATRELISDYQTWYEKALECKKAVDELKDAQRELAEDKLENILKHYEIRIDRVDSATARQEAIIERKIALGKEVLAGDYEALLNENERRAALLTQQYNDLNAEFTSLVDRGLIEEGSDAWFEYRQELSEIDEALIQADIDAQGFRDDMHDLALATLEYAQSMLEHTQSTIEQMMDLHETQKETLTFKEYSSLIANGMDQIENLGKQIEHFKTLQEGLEIGSEKYREYQEEIENLEADILDIKISQEEWNDALIDLKIDELEKAREEYEKQNEALEKQLAIEEAIQELERARTQKNKLIYREDGIGYRYEADAEAVRDAQKELDELHHEQMMDKIDEAIDALENLKGDENIYDYDANLIPYEGNLEQHLSQSMADEILNGLQNAGILDVLKQGVTQNTTSGSKSVSIAIGDVIVQEANDAGELADAIVNTLPMSIIQKVNTK